MRFISVIDSISKHIISLDADAFILRLDNPEKNVGQTRLKPYESEILYVLLIGHPRSLSYADITQVLKQNGLVITDETRIHRKLSQLRSFLENFHPLFKEFILNTRGIGYSLPLRIKNIHGLYDGPSKFKNAKTTQNILLLQTLIKESVELTTQHKIIPHDQGWITDRSDIKALLSEKIAIFNACESEILKELRVHEADFIMIRAQYLLAKLRTYIGLARISDYAISKNQWDDWFEQEAGDVFEDLRKLIKLAED
jgi:hypothetical protein